MRSMSRLLKAAQDEALLPVDVVAVRAVDVVADKAKLVHRQPKSSSVWPGFLRNQ